MKKVLLLLILPILSFGQESNVYKVIQTIENVEVREYRPLLFASYINLENENSQNSSFRILADYIFGYNDVNEEIAMTSPVIIRLYNNNEMLFRIPKKYTKQSVPKPNNKKIKLIETNYVHKAIIQYSGYSNAGKEKRKIKELKTILEKHNIRHSGKFELLVYDPPYKFFNRRNEISVNLLK